MLMFSNGGRDVWHLFSHGHSNRDWEHYMILKLHCTHIERFMMTTTGNMRTCMSLLTVTWVMRWYIHTQIHYISHLYNSNDQFTLDTVDSEWYGCEEKDKLVTRKYLQPSMFWHFCEFNHMTFYLSRNLQGGGVLTVCSQSSWFALSLV